MSKMLYAKNALGEYRVRGYVTPDALAEIAANILLTSLMQQEKLLSPHSAARFLQLALATEKNEVFGALFLNTQHKVLSFERLFSGTIDKTAVYPRVVLQKALEWNASAVIFVHNHPSGECEPSAADRVLTKRLTSVLEPIDVRVLDHFVVSRKEWVSMAERGWI